MKKFIILFLFVLLKQVAIAQESKPIYFSVKKWAVGEYSSLSKKYLFDNAKEVMGYLSVSNPNKIMKFTINLSGEASELTVNKFLSDDYNNGKHQMMFNAHDSGNNTVNIKVVDQNDGTFSIYTFYDNSAVVFYCTPLK